jgi:hypothetical protein
MLNAKAKLISIHTGWCDYCHEQKILMGQWYQTYKDQGLEIFSILAADAYHNQSHDAVLEWCCVESEDIYGSTYVTAIDPGYAKTDMYFDENAVPLNMVVDYDMVIRYKVHGYDPATLEATIQQLLQE